jgi:hypothetical protein
VPQTAFVIGAIAQLSAGVYSSISSYQQGKSQRALYEYNAKVQEKEAQAQTAKANEAAGIAMSASTGQREKVRRAMASQKATMAASGINTDQSESSLLVQTDTLQNLQLQNLEQRRGLFGQVEEFQAGAQRSLQGSALSKFQGKLAYQAGVSSAIGTGLSTAGSTLMNAATYSSANMGGKPPATNQGAFAFNPNKDVSYLATTPLF